MPEYYAISDLVVLPSLKEATSITGLEAMACGKPLVGTNVGGIPSLIENGKNGFLVPPKNSKKLANAIVQIFHNTNTISAMGAYGKRKAETEFSWQKITERTIEAYERCLSD